MHFDIWTIFQAISRRRWWIILPTVAFTAIAVFYALFKQDYWTATQALYIRNESLGQNAPFGRFESVDSMQTAQETMLEIAHHNNVLREALRSVGPTKRFWSKRKRDAWPTDQAVDDFRKCVNIAAPNGAQFGRTEMVYLTVKAENSDRAAALTAAMTEQLIKQSRNVRRQKYDGIVEELCTSAAIAQTELEKATLKLIRMDRQLGSDVVEMRVINNSSQGDGTLRRSLGEIRSEIRGARDDYSRKKMGRDQLVSMMNDPSKLISFPSELLDSQPTLRRLKDGLVDAQVTIAQLNGELNGKHPRIKSAILAEKEIRTRVYKELRNAIENIDIELQMAHSKLEHLNAQMKDYEHRFVELSSVRTQYNRLSKEVEFKSEVVEQLEKNMSVARANLATAGSVSLIQEVDRPIASIRPIGPGGKTIVLTGMIGGVFVGLGLIWLAEPVQVGQDRRCTSINGRRSIDQILLNSGANASRTTLMGPGRRLEDKLMAVNSGQLTR